MTTQIFTADFAKDGPRYVITPWKPKLWRDLARFWGWDEPEFCKRAKREFITGMTALQPEEVREP